MRSTTNPSPNHITPLFWQHGEDPEILREEIARMHESGILSFVVEPRPHPDFLGPTWWRDVDVILDEAKKRHMMVWFFDDSHYPSGYAAGLIKKHRPWQTKRYLTHRRIDTKGPLKGFYFNIGAWLSDDEPLLGVVGAKRTDGKDMIDSKTLIRLDHMIDQGRLYWDVPEGDWRIFIFYKTPYGGEAHTADYLNPIDQEAVKSYLEFVHEAFYERYKEDFGNTIQGFFVDEPRFGNIASYQASLGAKFMEFPSYGSNSPSGNQEMVLPYADDLFSIMSATYGSDIVTTLPLLWYDDNRLAAHVRYLYMNTVSTLFGERFIGQLSAWCRDHNVRLMGHIVEDSGAHARLGYGSGHFFKNVKHMDIPGYDIVFQAWPGLTSGRHTSPFGYLDMTFFHWGIGKMASSASHIYSKGTSTTLVELFGAYGWQAGLKLMKWLTDHVVVRGANLLVPHAFSPKADDPDCPPHFYSRNDNPQWRYFNLWSSYAQRLCDLLTDGVHIAPVAVLYHAEAEWAGQYMPFETVTKHLMTHQIDCDIVPMDALLDPHLTTLQDHRFIINRESYKALVIPYSEKLPKALLDSLITMSHHNIPVIFIDGWPSAVTESPMSSSLVEDIREKNMMVPLNQLANMLDDAKIPDVHLSDPSDDLRVYRYQKQTHEHLLFTNESTDQWIRTTVRLTADGYPVFYDCYRDRYELVSYRADEGIITFDLELAPYGSLFLILSETLEHRAHHQRLRMKDAVRFEPSQMTPWRVSLSDKSNPSLFTYLKTTSDLVNLATLEQVPEFSGTIRYETTMTITKPVSNRVLLDLGELYEISDLVINGINAGVLITPPYQYDVTDLIKDGANTLVIDVTNTLAKARGNNLYDRAMAQEPSGLIGPVKWLLLSDQD
ncbi:MAG: hypothetical protein K9K93_00525 [Acholeplasmataceae bacterium]|nr:hypothetical protein [Acholeplasmataceae bacterium]